MDELTDNQASNFRAELQYIESFIATENCRNEGALVEYQDRGCEKYVKLWVMPGESRRVLRDVGGGFIEEQTTRTFGIPRQYGCACGVSDCVMCGCYAGHEEVLVFPPPLWKCATKSNDPSVYALIVYEGFEWAVDEWKADSLEVLFELSATRHQARASKR